jgi:hypothetical protein
VANKQPAGLWRRRWIDWLPAVALSIAATAVVVVALFSATWFDHPVPLDCTDPAAPKNCEQLNNTALATRRTDNTSTGVKIATGLLAFAAGYVALRAHLLKRDEVELTAAASDREHELAQRQQRLDRYNTAITNGSAQGLVDF